jgi:hypothetical protein
MLNCIISSVSELRRYGLNGHSSISGGRIDFSLLYTVSRPALEAHPVSHPVGMKGNAAEA